MPQPSLPAEKPGLRRPLLVDRYAIYDEFAAGGMATVHFARMVGAGGFRRSVAVKRLLPSMAQDRELSLMLADEARIASRVRHPNVVATLDVVQTPSELVLVMEYVHGESVAGLVKAARLKDEPVPMALAIAWVIDALHGLHAAHEATDESGVSLGLVHRDVSPQNMLVGTDGITRIADFGIAKARGRAMITRTGSFKGKLAYMAPEQIERRELSRTTDVFAASVVLWELLAGEPLFVADSAASIVFSVLHAPIEPPSRCNPLVPPELDRIVMRGLAREPGDRFASARELASALEACVPSVRPSEVAAWVERIGAESLRERAQKLAAIEEAFRADTLPEATVIGPPPSHEVDRESRPRDSEPQSERRAIKREMPRSSDARPAREAARPRLRLLAWLVPLGLLGGVGLFALGLTLRQPTAAPTSSAPAAAEQEAEAPTLRTPLTLAAEPTTAPLAAPPSLAPDAMTAPQVEALPLGAVPVEAAPDASTSKRPRSTRTAREGAVSPPARPGGRAERERAAHACDPPYSLDLSGRRIFKLECM